MDRDFVNPIIGGGPMTRALFITMALFTTTALSQTPAPSASSAQCQPPPSPLPRTRPAMIEPGDTDSHYRLAVDAIPQEGVPQGEIKGPYALPSAAYPCTQHTYWVYVPKQYDSAVAASLMIYNDGQAFMAPDGDIRAPVVMDNLIYRREIPVMIAVFINPGRYPGQPEPSLHEWGDRTTN